MRNVVYLFVILAIYSCSNTTKNNEINENEDALKLEAEKAEAAKKIKDSIDKQLSLIEVRLFEHSGLDYDYDGWCVNGGMMPKERVVEIENFKNSGTHKCKLGRYIQSIELEGEFYPLNISFYNQNGEVIEQLEDFTLDKSYRISTENSRSNDDGSTRELKDKDYKPWFGKATKLTIAYKDSIFYTADWKSSTKRYRQ